MKRVLRVVSLVVAMVATTVPGAAAAPGEMLIVTGVVDGPLTGGIPKVVEIYAVTDIADLSDFGVGSANNGGGTDGQEFTFPAGSLSAGDYVYIATEAVAFETFFGFAPTYTSGMASINGDDAIEVFHLGAVVDTFGEIDQSGVGQPWEYTDGWAKRIGLTASASFDVSDWTFSGPDALDGVATNSAAAIPYAIETAATPGPVVDGGPLTVFIHEVQGPGAVSPLVGETVIIEGVVVGDQETFSRLAGFFVQEEDVDVDDNALTSEGVFVFNSFRDSVSIGDVVRVEGLVQERFNNTQISATSVEVLGEEEVLEKNRTVTPAEVVFPLDAVSDLEAVEGMSVVFSQTLVVSEYFNYDRFGEVVIALPFGDEDRPYTPTAVAEPGSAEMLERLSWNLRSRITIDDGITSQNPNEVIHPINRDPFTLENRFRGGDEVTGIVGTIYFDFGLYRLLPTGFDTYDRTERPESPDEVGGRLQVATLNALNYFVTLDDGVNDVCGADQSQECRGADSVGEFERQRVKLIAALVGLDADVVGLVEIENTPGVSPLADIVSGLNDALGARTYDYIDTGVAGTDAIKVGIIYKPAAVTQIGRTAVLDSPEFLDPTGSGEDRNRAAV
ncbi:MAG TPA: endonuclease I, partial [Acidimicrobiia bacterium]|nr:endonuclease I [Acidimicrobiia bacterium]